MFLDGFSRQSLTLLPANAQLSAENDRCLQSSTGSEAASTVDVEDGARVCNPRPVVETACRPFVYLLVRACLCKAVGRLKNLQMRGSLCCSGRVHSLSRVTLEF